MPGIYTPPRLDPDHHVSDGDHGAGRRPPTDKFTGGNGEGDNWQDRPVGSRGPWERLHQARVGLVFGLGGVAAIFIALVSMFLVTKGTSTFNAQHEYVRQWRAITLPRMLIFNTIVLLISSITAEIARRSMFREIDAMEEWIGLGKPTSRRALLWLTITLALGVMFLAGQTVAWSQLNALPPYIRVLKSADLFYLFTGTHAVHVIGGLIGLIAAIIKLRTSPQFATRRIWVDTTVWYWHAMGVLWLGIYALLAFGQ